MCPKNVLRPAPFSVDEIRMKECAFIVFLQPTVRAGLSFRSSPCPTCFWFFGLNSAGILFLLGGNGSDPSLLKVMVMGPSLGL